MSLPVGVTTSTITVGKPFSSGGNNGTVSATVTPDFGGPTHIIWAATGDTYENFAESYPSDGSAVSSLSFTVPCVDQAGWIDPSGAPFTGWAYTVQVVAKSANGAATNKYPRRISPLIGTGTTDLDSLVELPPAVPTLGTIPATAYARVVAHGSDASVPRPVGATVVIWAGTVAPTYMDPSYDLWVGPA